MGRLNQAILRHCRYLLYVNKYVGRGEIGLVPRYGVGDYYLVAAYAKAFEETHGLKPKIFTPQNRLQLVQAFVPEKDIIPIYGLDEKGATGVRFFSRLLPYNAHFYQNEFKSLVASGYNLISAYKKILKLPEKATANVPKLCEAKDALEVRQKFGLMGDRYMLAFPGATTTPKADEDKWVAVIRANALKDGLKICWNSAPKSGLDAFNGECLIPDASFREIYKLALGAECIVLARSGICEWLSSVPVQQWIIYPDLIYNGRIMLESASLHELPNSSFRREVTLDRFLAEFTVCNKPLN